MLCASSKTTSGAFPHSRGKRLSASAPTRLPVPRATIGCSTTLGPPAVTSGSRRASMSSWRCCSRISGSMITDAAEASTFMSDSSRPVSSLSEVNPNAQKVP